MPGGEDEALRILLPLLATSTEHGYGSVRTCDGEADVYGLGTDGLMFNHGSGRQIWQVTTDVTTGTNWEGRGVIPDLACPADEALGAALNLDTAGK